MTLYHVDAFTSEAFSGNPAAICVLGKDQPDSWKQKMAAEMNLSETAFVLPKSEGFLLRWFTPRTEVPLCGHATLATAHILWEEGILSPTRQARFRTLRNGTLTAAKRESWIEMDFPAKILEECPVDPDIAGALGAKPFCFEILCAWGWN